MEANLHDDESTGLQPHTEPRGRAISTTMRVYDDVRQRIVGLEIAPGTTLDRAELSGRYKVSQTPIRDALLRLEQDGLIHTYPQSRTVVTKIDSAQIDEAHFLRVSIECEVVRQLAGNPDTLPISRFRSMLLMQQALRGDIKNARMFRQLDLEFHYALFNAAGQPGLFHLIRSNDGHLARAQRLDLPKEGKMARAVAAHMEIIDKIEQGDSSGAQDAMRQHLSGTISRINSLKQEYPEHFL